MRTFPNIANKLAKLLRLDKKKKQVSLFCVRLFVTLQTISEQGMEETLKDKTAKGLFWGGMSNAFQQVVGVVFGIILGRLLDRSDYGMIAMITIFSLIASELQNGGFKVALINQKVVDKRDYNAVFWFNVLTSITVYLLLFFASPLIARYYHQPALVWLCRYAFLSFVLASFGVAQLAWLTKHFKIRELSQCGMISVLLSSAIGALMAWLKFGYWALATQNLLFIIINTLLVWRISHWRPTLRIDLRPAVRMFPFSAKIMFSGILTHINVNVMNIMLGRHFSAQSTGDYNQAYQWSSKCYILVQNMLKQVDQNVLAGLRDERERQLYVLRKMMRFTSFVSFPLLFGLGLVAHEFIVLTIGEKWATSASLLPLLCISGAFIPLTTLMADSILAHGRSDFYMWCTVLLGVVQIVLMSILWPYGMRVMVEVFVVVNLLWVVVWFFFTHRLTGYGWLALGRDVLPFALSALGVMVFTHFLTLSVRPLWLLLASRGVTAALLYYVVLRVAHVKILADCQQFISSRLKRKRN